MSFNENQRSLLGMTVRQQKILHILEKNGRENVSVLSERTGIPRTSVGFLLNGLCRRGLVEKVPVNGHKEWQVIGNDRLTERLRSILQEGLPPVSYAEGEKGYLDLVKIFFQETRGKRVRMIQSLSSVHAQINKFNDAAFRSCVFELHRQIKRMRIVGEGVTCQSTLTAMRSLGATELRSHLGRPLIAHIVPDEFLHFSADVFICGDRVMLLDFGTELLVSMKNAAFAQLFECFFDELKLRSKKVDLNALMRGIMEEKVTIA